MEVGGYLVADAQAFELVEPGEGRLDDPAGLAQARAVWGATAGDLGSDAADDAAVGGEVAAAVSENPLGSAPRSAAPPADAGYRVQQRDEPGDGVAVCAGQRDGARGAVPVGAEVVPAAETGPVDRRRSGASPL
jgi:hypothetical protein